jgi:hypothetical protein
MSLGTKLSLRITTIGKEENEISKFSCLNALCAELRKQFQLEEGVYLLPICIRKVDRFLFLYNL